MYYLALVLDAEDGLDFICPDVPGFTAHAPTKDFGEAVAVAREVLAGHLGVLLDGGHALPAPRDYAGLTADPNFAEDFAEAITTVLLPALVPAGRSVRVNVSLDENTLQLIDSAAKDRSLTRSAFIAEACRQFAGSTGLGLVRKAFEPSMADTVEHLTAHGGLAVGSLGEALTKVHAGEMAKTISEVWSNLPADAIVVRSGDGYKAYTYIEPFSPAKGKRSGKKVADLL